MRNRIPEIIKSKGGMPAVRRMTDDEYELALLSKLLEESQELGQAEARRDRLEEAADVDEVLAAIAKLSGLDMAEVADAADRKRAEKGGFSEKIWLDSW